MRRYLRVTWKNVCPVLWESLKENTYNACVLLHQFFGADSGLAKEVYYAPTFTGFICLIVIILDGHFRRMGSAAHCCRDTCCLSEHLVLA